MQDDAEQLYAHIKRADIYGDELRVTFMTDYSDESLADFAYAESGRRESNYDERNNKKSSKWSKKLYELAKEYMELCQDSRNYKNIKHIRFRLQTGS